MPVRCRCRDRSRSFGRPTIRLITRDRAGCEFAPMTRPDSNFGKRLLLCAALALAVLASSAGWRHSAAAAAQDDGSGRISAQSDVTISSTEVAEAVQAAAEAMAGPNLSIVVVDRRNDTLAAWHRAGATDHEDELALGLARAGAFFSN